MSVNPFQSLEERLENIECLLREIKSQPKEEIQDKLYSVNEAADILGIAEVTLRLWVKQGKIKAERFGRRIRIRHKDLYDSGEEVKSLKYQRP